MTFTKKEFEELLPHHKVQDFPVWVPEGLLDGEEMYSIPMRNDAKVLIKSSVKKNGKSRKNLHVRCLIADDSNNHLGSDLTYEVHKVQGWEKRFTCVLRYLWRVCQHAGTCPECNRSLGIHRVRKDNKNKGRLFATCLDHENIFKWLT